MSAPVSVSEGAPDLAATEQVADELVASFDKPTDALAAVLLAADRGYDFEQIAATDGVLQADGQIVDADGGQVLPRYEPSELLLDDRAGVQGLRSPPKLHSLTALLSRAEDQHDEAALVAVLMMLAWGYAPQQIVTAILTNAPVNGLFQILDEDGDAVRPFLQNTNEPPARQRAAGDAPATTVASPPPTDDSEPTGSDDTFAAAAGVYRLQERSLRVAVESSVERYLSADGAIVIEPNGAVSGDYSFCDSETGVDTATGQAFESEVTSESSIDPATTPLFTETENGLRFGATMLVGLATENTLGQSYTNEGASFTVTGLVDVESGVLELTAPGSEFAIDFIR